MTPSELQTAPWWFFDEEGPKTVAQAEEWLSGVSEPPCCVCEHFRPVPVTRPDGFLDGAAFCHGPAMKPDFACFTERGA